MSPVLSDRFVIELINTHYNINLKVELFIFLGDFEPIACYSEQFQPPKKSFPVNIHGKIKKITQEIGEIFIPKEKYLKIVRNTDRIVLLL